MLKMTASYDILHQMFIQETAQLPKEFIDVITQINQEQYDPSICELVNFLSRQEVPYITYTHV